jgi:hypothetical protein
VECFVHEGRQAVAICRACGKGACRACAVPVGNLLACSEACRPLVASLSELQLASVRSVGVMRAQRFTHPAMGLVFLALGVWLGTTQGWSVFSLFFVSMGVLVGASWAFAGRKKA